MTAFLNVSAAVPLRVTVKLMKATAKIASEKIRAMAAAWPPAPGKNDPGTENMPTAMSVSAMVLSHSIHVIDAS